MSELRRRSFASRVTAAAAAIVGCSALLLQPVFAPAANAKMWSPANGQMNILVVGCTFSGDPPTFPGMLPTADNFSTLLTGSPLELAPGDLATDLANLVNGAQGMVGTPPNLSSYLAEVSYGAITGVTSTFSGWNSLPHEFESYQKDLADSASMSKQIDATVYADTPAGRIDKQQAQALKNQYGEAQDNDCASTAQSGGYNLDSYSVVAMIYSRDTGLTDLSLGTNRIRLRPNDPVHGTGGHSAWTALADWAHEIGHRFGFQHSCTETSPGRCATTYNNPFDEMSGLQDSSKSHWYFGDRLGPGWCVATVCWTPFNTIQSVPVHYAAYQKDLLGWLGKRAQTFQGGTQRFFIDRLAMPREVTGHSTLMVKIPAPSGDYYYTLETRRKVSYDAGLNTNEGIVIHRVEPGPNLDNEPSARLIVQNLLPSTDVNDGPSPAASNAAFQVGETALLENGTITVQVAEHVDSDNDGDGYWVVVSAPLVAQANFLGQGDPLGVQGSWRGSYGARGAWIQGDANNIGLPVNGAKPVVWLASTNDARALQKTGSATDRVAGGWTGDKFSFDLDLQSTNRVSLYAVDWDGQNVRKERIDIVDRLSGKVLDSETVSNFAHGTYLMWYLTGHLQVRVVSLSSSWTAAVSGVFLDGPASVLQPPAH